MEKHAAYLLEGVDACKDAIFTAERHIWSHPESGYREWKTHKYMADIFENLGYELTLAGNIPGFYTVLDTGRPGPTVCVLPSWILSSMRTIRSATPKPRQSTPVGITCSAPAWLVWPPPSNAPALWMA